MKGVKTTARNAPATTVTCVKFSTLRVTAICVQGMKEGRLGAVEHRCVALMYAVGTRNLRSRVPASYVQTMNEEEDQMDQNIERAGLTIALQGRSCL